MSLKQITKLTIKSNAARTLVTSSIKNNNLSKTNDLPKLEKVYNTIKNLNEEDENDEYAELYRTGRGSDA